MNLTIAAGKTSEDFDSIDEFFVEEEKSLALVEDSVGQELQNKLDEQLANITDKVAQDVGMI